MTTTHSTSLIKKPITLNISRSIIMSFVSCLAAQTLSLLYRKAQTCFYILMPQQIRLIFNCTKIKGKLLTHCLMTDIEPDMT